MPGMSGGYGHLRVAPQALECELGAMARKFSGIEGVRHNDNTVHVYKARLIPFWFNLSAVISDGQTRVCAFMSAFSLQELVGALKDSGFEVELHRTWLFRGLSFADLSGNQRRRNE
jgi:hypothetical protein